MLETLLASKAGQSLFGNLGSGLGKGIGDALGGAPAGPAISGSSMDSRSFMDGSGWTVSTGGSKATGSTRGDGPDLSGSQPSANYNPAFGGQMQAGMSPVMMVAMLAAVAWYIARK